MKFRLPSRRLSSRLTSGFVGMFLGALVTGQTVLMVTGFVGMLVFYVIFCNNINEN
jgi:hypothetical protein